MAISLTLEKAPENFHISSINEDDSHLSCYNRPCLLCNYPKKLFFCRDCIRNGDFIHSSHHLSERFSEKQSKYLNLKAAHRILETRCLQNLQRKILCENFRHEITQRKRNIAIIKEIVKNKKDVTKKGNALKKELEDANRLLRISLPKYENNVKKQEDYVCIAAENNERRKQNLRELEDKLKALRRVKIEQIDQIIFSISKSINKSVSSESELSNEISEATRTAYVKGKWILQDSFGENQFIIVAPSLNHLDYSFYNDWVVSANKENYAAASNSSSYSSDSTLSCSQNPIYRITAALTYTTQLVLLLAYYLDIKLPYKVVYSDFCTTSLTEGQFSRKVARLNANIMFLCYTQKCKLNALNPNRTLGNIYHLLKLENTYLGRMGYVEIANCIDETTDLSLVQDLEFGGEDSDDYSDEENTQEWETLPSVSNLENVMPIITHGTNSIQSGMPTHSMAGGLVASVASFWRGWTTGK